MGLGPARIGGDFVDLIIGAQTRGRGRAGMDEAAKVEGAPEGPAIGLPCPRCGAVLHDLHAAGMPTRNPTHMIECKDCGFVGLREA